MYKALAKSVEAGDMSNELAEALSSGIYDENKIELSKLRDEAKTLRIKNEEHISSFGELNDTVSILKGKVSNYDDDIAKAKEDGKSDTVKVLEAERKSHKNLVDRFTEYEKDNIRLKIANAVSSEIGNYDIKSDLRGSAENEIRSMVNIGDNGIIFGDGLTMQDGVKDYFSTRGSFLKSIGTGTGSGATDRQGGTVHVPKTEDMSASQKMEAGRNSK